jgi:hypothetical protein
LAFYFPDIHAAIDWTRSYEWLNTELRQVVRDAELGKRLADVLVKVWYKDGKEEWLFIHIEVQGWPESDFPHRMFVYHYRIFDRYNRQVVSLAVLADDRPQWRPNRFGYQLGRCRLEFEFDVAKLLDFMGQEAVLQASDNPFALITRAHLAMLQTRQDAASRLTRKVGLVRELYVRGMSRDEVLEFFRLIDWMMDLPPALEPLFQREAEQIEQELHMPYVTSIERLAKQEGQAEGRAEGKAEGKAETLLHLLTRHYGVAVPESLATRIRSTTDSALLERWLDLIFDAPTLDEFQQRMQL